MHIVRDSVSDEHDDADVNTGTDRCQMLMVIKLGLIMRFLKVL